MTKQELIDRVINDIPDSQIKSTFIKVISNTWEIAFEEGIKSQADISSMTYKVYEEVLNSLRKK